MSVKVHNLGFGNGSLIENIENGTVQYRPTGKLLPAFYVNLSDVTGVSGERKGFAHVTMKIHGKGTILAETKVNFQTTEKVAEWFKTRINAPHNTNNQLQDNINFNQLSSKRYEQNTPKASLLLKLLVYPVALLFMFSGISFIFNEPTILGKIVGSFFITLGFIFFMKIKQKGNLFHYIANIETKHIMALICCLVVLIFIWASKQPKTINTDTAKIIKKETIEVKRKKREISTSEQQTLHLIHKAQFDLKFKGYNDLRATESQLKEAEENILYEK